MPKPPTFQRPVPVNRTNKGLNRPGASLGKPGRNAPRRAPQADLPASPQLDLNLPKTPRLPWK